MPIDTSIITGTKAHKHTFDSSAGGFLSSTETGMTNLTQGGILQGNATNIQTNLPIGNPHEILKVNAGATALEYSATMTSLTSQQSLQSGIFSTSSASFVAVGNGLVLTLPTRTNGKAIVIVNYSLKNSSAANNYVTLLDDGTSNGVLQTYTTTTEDVLGSISSIFPLDGSQIDLGVKCSAGTIFVIQSPAAVVGSILALEIS